MPRAYHRVYYEVDSYTEEGDYILQRLNANEVHHIISMLAGGMTVKEVRRLEVSEEVYNQIMKEVG